ncbi:Aste57867_10806 [Aphanomyces stellatus]|uniref:Aste57867_10806 protein n=1 Tax=Aphanomyces stellatus TaxID=120398 RepID=A0A485KSG5_9STRA|nr:hypothetical protein As57867_010766 [Aphanomyces stellatus]VFT87675.1 Aste57867_10806 [Aphanomyces stellatus]
MGSCISNEAYDAAVLVPVKQPLAVIHSKFASPIPVTLIMKKKLWSWSGDDFSIKDLNTGVPYFKFDGSAFSFRDKKTLLDFKGNPVAIMEEPVLSFTRWQEVFKPDMTKWFDITPRITMFENVLDCEVRDCVTGKKYVLGVQGNWLARKSVVTCNGVPIAKIRSPITYIRDVYYVDIAKGVDMALVVLLCMALDEAVERR